MAEGAKEILAEAYSLTTSFNLTYLRSRIDEFGVIIEQSPLIVKKEDKYLAIFEYGSVVFFNFCQDEKQNCLKKLKNCSGAVAGHAEFMDDLIIRIGGEEKQETTTEQLWVKEESVDVIKLVAIVLSRSVSLEYYEDLIENTMAALEEPVNLLIGQGKIRLGMRKYIQKFGKVLRINLMLVHGLQLFDEPDITWQIKKNQKIYKELRDIFSLNERGKNVEYKLKLVKESCKFIIDMQQYRSANVLELAIIVLFIIEIIKSLS